MAGSIGRRNARYRCEVLWMWSKKELIEKQARFWLVIAGGSTLQAACDAVGVDR
jgi:hypothetical protein